MESLKQEQDNLEQYTRRNTLCISGLPEKPYEDVASRALKLFNRKMKVPITINDIDRAHRFGKKKDDRPRGIMVKFATYRARSSVFRAKACLYPGGASRAPTWSAADAAGLAPDAEQPPPEGDTSDPVEEDLLEFRNIFISEDLTGPRQFLLWQARLARRARALKRCWSHDGQVLVEDKNGKVHPINTPTDLESITGIEVKPAV